MDIKLPIMKLVQLELPTLLPLTFLLLLPIILLIKRGYNTNLNLPPGPWKLPIIGSLGHLLATIPHRGLHRLAQKHGPIMLVRLGQADALVVSSPEAASEVMKAQDLNFCTRPELPIRKVIFYGYTDVLFAPYGNYWRQLKKICIIELLNSQRVRSFHSIFEEEISKLISDINYAWSEKKTVNLCGMLGTQMNNVIARCAFGTKSDRQVEFITEMEDMVKLVSGLTVVDLFPNIKYIDVLSGIRSKVNRVHKHLDEILGGIIKQHQFKQVEEIEDLVDVLLRIKDRDELEFKLTEDNIKSVILDMFSAGSVTSSTLLAWTMSELMKNPKMRDKATTEVRRVLRGKTKIEDSDLGELHYLKCVIKETLRFHPPVPLIARKCIKACEVDGYNIPEGTRVLINVWALGRDPRYWDDAESFKPERFSGSHTDSKGTNFEFLPFGAGRRICPGITFSEASMMPTLAQLLLHFNWELPNGMMPQELDMTEAFGITAARKTELCLLATPYSPSVSTLRGTLGLK